MAAFSVQTMTTTRLVPQAPWLGPCTEWVGETSTQGLGRFVFAGHRPVGAHAFALQVVGRRRTPGFRIDHLCHSYDRHCLGGDRCRHRTCVNPAHLEYVSASVHGTRVTTASPYNGGRGRLRVWPSCQYGHPYLPGCFHYEGSRRVCHLCTGQVELSEDWQELAAAGYRLA